MKDGRPSRRFGMTVSFSSLGDRDATASDAVVAVRARRLSSEPAGLNARRALLGVATVTRVGRAAVGAGVRRIAIVGERVLADAELAVTTRVEARLDRGTRLALRRVREARDVAAARAVDRRA